MTFIKYIDLFCGLGAFHAAFDKVNLSQNKKRQFLGRNRQPPLPLVRSLREPSSDSYGLHRRSRVYYKCVLLQRSDIAVVLTSRT